MDEETITKGQLMQEIPGVSSYGTLAYQGVIYDLLRLPPEQARHYGWHFYLLRNDKAFAVLRRAHSNVYHIQLVSEPGISWGELFVEDSEQQWRYVDNRKHE